MSPCTINLLTPDGLQPAPYTADSLADAVQYEPHDGVYTLANTFNTTQVLKLDAHLHRLEDSARRENIPLKLDRPALRKGLRHMIEQAGYGDVRYRITVPRDNPAHFILSIEPFQGFPPEIYADGVRCITLPDSARPNPAAKTTAWMQHRDQFALPPGVFTGLLLDKAGYILEGMSSNFYAVLKDELRTAGAGVLPGIAQQIIFEIAPAILPLKREAVHIEDIAHFSEAFISGSSRGIVPVVEIDGITLGDGKPGAQTRALREAYAGWMKTHLEEL
jgi:branched-chain amino acid aminotransferase